MNEQITAIARLVNGQIMGDPNRIISSLTNIDEANAQSLVFAQDKKNWEKAIACDAAAILVGTNTGISSGDKVLIRVDNPKVAFIKLLNHYYRKAERKPMIHPTACIADNVTLGENCHIGPFVVIEEHSVIGDGCCLMSHVSLGRNVILGNHVTLHPQVTVYDNCQLADFVTVHAGSVIGSDGFGYEFADGVHQKIPHIGNVIIGKHVEIGANTVVDRATLGATTIGDGTKIDNLVQVAHSVKLGRNNIICAFTGIAGSSTSGDNVVFAANVGVSDHVTIEDHVILGARTGVPPRKTLKSGQVYLGSPARPKDKAIENELSLTRIPLMRKQIKAVNQKIKAIEHKLSE